MCSSRRLTNRRTCIDMTATGPAACVWDLRVIGFERDAWLSKVLRNPGGPDIDAYLFERLNEDA